MRELCLRLWPKFILPIQDGTHLANQFHKLVVHTRPMFQAEGLLLPSVIANVSTIAAPTAKSKGIATQLPYYSRLLLVAAYLASFNPPRTDSLHFMKSAAAKRRKKGGGTAISRPGVAKHRKISRKLLGAQAFVIERLLAIFHTIAEDADDRGRRGKASGEVVGAADLQMAIATLASLRLMVKMGPSNAGDALEGGCKYRVAVGWEVVRGVARSVGLEADDYLAE
jgi:origin recognition complex subunit 5